MAEQASGTTEMADFSVYRSVELGKKIGETLSLVERAKTIFRPIALVTLGLALLARLILLADATWLRVLGTGYGALAGLVVGVFAAAAWLVHTELRRIEELLLLILDVSARVARARAGEDADQRPTPAQLLPPVYAQVFEPMITEVVRKQFRLLGRPLSWIIGGVLDRAVKLLAGVLERRNVGWEWFERESEAKEDESPKAEAPEAEEPEAEEPEADQPEQDPSESPGTRALVEEVGQRIRRMFRPVWISLVLLAALALSPVALVAYLAG